MNNRELYKRSFDKLQPSKEFEKELTTMMEEKQTRRFKRPGKVLVLVAAVSVMLTLAVAASAAGVWQNVRLWINGQEVDASAYMDENGDISVEATGEGRIDVLFTDEESTDGEIVIAPNIDAAYENVEGQDLLRFTNADTSETETLDITGKLENGCYQDTVTIFGCICNVELTVGEDTVNLSFSVEGFE